jgi:hypothetical protein
LVQEIMWWFYWWLLFVIVLFLVPVGYGWGYRGWGPPYPYPYRRTRLRTEATPMAEQRQGATYGAERHVPAGWGWGADVEWLILIIAVVWLLWAISH